MNLSRRGFLSGIVATTALVAVVPRVSQPVPENPFMAPILRRIYGAGLLAEYMAVDHALAQPTIRLPTPPMGISHTGNWRTVNRMPIA